MLTKVGSVVFIFARFWVGKQHEALVDVTPEYLLTLVKYSSGL